MGYFLLVLQHNISVVCVLYDEGGTVSNCCAVLLDVFDIRAYNPANMELVNQDEVLLIGYLNGKDCSSGLILYRSANRK